MKPIHIDLAAIMATDSDTPTVFLAKSLNSAVGSPTRTRNDNVPTNTKAHLAITLIDFFMLILLTFFSFFDLLIERSSATVRKRIELAIRQYNMVQKIDV